MMYHLTIKNRLIMKKIKIIGALLCALCLAACSNDDDIDLFPEGTASLRMMNEDNGRTLLGNSDVYITKDGNFSSDQYPLFDMGERKGISDINMPDFTNMAPSVAVEPGHGYVVCNANDVLFFSDSRTYAIAENANVYRIYVDTWIRDQEDNITGANVRFLLGKPTDGMPAWDSTAGTIYMVRPTDRIEPVRIDLPEGDIEVKYLGDDTQTLTHSISGRTLTITKQDFYIPGSDHAEYSLLVRSGHVYTRLTVRAEYRDE